MRARPADLFIRLALLAAVGAWPLRPAAQQQPPPTFRAGVDVVQLDVVVLDGNRRPVRGLTADDFTVLERGVVQPIVAFTEVQIPPPPVESGASWTREVDADVVSNDRQTSRLIVLLMDDALTGVDEGEPRLAREIALRIVDELSPADLAAVVFTSFGRNQNLTTRRGELRAAIESFRPKNLSSAGPPLGCALRVGGCTVNALASVGELLRQAPPGRKFIFYIGPGPVMNTTMADPDGPAMPSIVRDMLRSLHQANATVYSFDPRGLRVGGRVDSNEIALPESTGGRRVEHTNAPARMVPEIFAENRSYYLLGYRAPPPGRDGRFRPVEVRTKRPGLAVHTRSGYYPPRRETATPVMSALDAAVLRGVPSGDLAIRVATAPFAVPGRREAEVVVIAAVRDSMADPSGERARPGAATLVRRVESVAAVFDSDWRSRGAYRQTAEVTIHAAAERAGEYELISRLRLPPGRYEIRVGAEADGRAGSVFASVDVPDFARAPLAISGVLVERVPGLPNAPPDAIADLAPVVPTSVRDLTAAQRATVFARVYQAKAPVDVTVRSRLIADTGRVVAEDTQRLEAARFRDGHGAGFEWVLPVAGLPAGAYLLQVEAAAGGRTVTRDVRFTVAPQ